MPVRLFYLTLIGLASAFHAPVSFAEPALSGQSGYINMPDGRVEADGTWRIGYSFQKPYASFWNSISMIPRVEFTAAYTRIMGVKAGEGEAWANYGDYKDKVFQGKFQFLDESDVLPAVSVGLNDFQGTGLFKAKFLAMSKQLGPVDATLGYGSGRIDGLFAGARYRTGVNGLSLVAEYDANNYAQDLSAVASGVAGRKKGLGVAAEYRWGWLGSQLSYRDGEAGVNAYVSIPLNEKDFVPKLDEPKPYQPIKPRPTLAQWNSDPGLAREMADVLYVNNFKNVRLRMAGNVLEATLTNTRIALASRAVGRAARILLHLSPRETREIRITYTQREMPVATYSFFELDQLRRYFNGQISRKVLVQYVSVDYADPQDRVAALDGLARGFEEEKDAVISFDAQEGDFVTLRREDRTLDRIKLAPGVAFYFNDPSGAFHYDIFLNGFFEKQLGQRTFLNLGADLTLVEDVSAVTQPSNSQLPHVRTDVAEYKKGGRLKLSQAMVSQYYHPRQRVYARASAGIFEEMYAGAGGQMLYLPERAPWAADFSMDWVRQRDFSGGLGFRDYSTVTALGALHYRLPIPGLSATFRAGRFLARDVGGRVEMKRRFRSGVEMGFWYTVTNGNDITSPGTPANPYHDKGVFLSIPLNIMLTRDTRAVSNFSIAPWTRDVGQMLRTPDLYDTLERPYLNLKDGDGLRYFGDLDDDYRMPRNETALDRMKWETFQRDLDNVSGSVMSDDAWRAIGWGVGGTLLSSVFDRRVDDFIARHEQNAVVRKMDKVGKWSPLAALGASGLMALDETDVRLNKTAFSALKAGAVAAVLAEGSKYAFGRARPSAGAGRHDFDPFSADNGDTSMPSGHTAVTWAVLTPYAKEYEMPWLYGVAALTNMGRIAGREHWLSDTVGGAFLGYAAGSLMWDSQRKTDKKGPEWTISPNSVAVSWQTE